MTSNEWDIAITNVDPDAADALLAYANTNPVPETGFRFVMVTFIGQYRGDSIVQPVFEWAFTDGKEEWGPEVPGCGLIPDSIYDVAEVVPDEVIVATICAPVPQDRDARDLVLYLRPPDGDAQFFSLRP